MSTSVEPQSNEERPNAERPGKNDVREVLLLAISHHREGRIGDAERIYRRILNADPDQPDALRLLGAIALSGQRPADAVTLLERATAAAPDSEVIAETLADARFAVAKASYDAGHYQAAMDQFQALVSQYPGLGRAWFYMGVIAHQRGAAPVAAQAYMHAQEVGLDTPELSTNLGIALGQVGRTAEAVTHQRRAVKLAPEATDLRLNLATALALDGQWPKAATACHAALRYAPRSAPVHSVLGTVRMRQGRYKEGLTAHAEALALAADDPAILPTVLNEYANARMDVGDTQGALALNAEALARAPHIPELHFHYALALLAAGRLPEGWVEYDWRWRIQGGRFPEPLVATRWHGQPLPDQSLIVWREQGLGDELMFASCLNDAIASGARVTLACTPRLRALFARSFPSVQVIDEQQLTVADFEHATAHAPLGDLPRWCRPNLEAFPARAAFLTADPERVEYWRRRLAELGTGRMIGICWRSGLLTPSRRGGYAALSEWETVLRTPNTCFVNLQYDHCAPEIETVQRSLGITVHRLENLDLRNDLDDTAALMSALDLVVSAPTAVGELAGALGVPTWRVTAGRDWTMFGTNQRPWFPTMRVFAREMTESWRQVFDRVANELRSTLSTLPPSAR